MAILDLATDERLNAIISDWIGGAEIVEALVLYYGDEKKTYRQLAELLNIRQSTLRWRMREARTKMERCGVWPAAWNKVCNAQGA